MRDGENRPKVGELLGQWLLEASVLLAVLPYVDQLVTTARMDWRTIASSVLLSLIAMAAGLYSARGGRR